MTSIIAPTAILDRCRARDVTLWVEGGRLRYDAPRGALSDDLRAALVAHKAALVEHLVWTMGVTSSRPAQAAPPRAAVVEPPPTDARPAPADWSTLAEQRWGPSTADDPSLDVAPDWRSRVASLTHDSWMRWRARSAELQSPHPDADEIRAAEHQAAVELGFAGAIRSPIATGPSPMKSEPLLPLKPVGGDPNTPRTLLPQGSPEWCHRTLELLRYALEELHVTTTHYDKVLAELVAQRAWEKVPSREAPYGSLDAMLAVELGPRSLRPPPVTGRCEWCGDRADCLVNPGIIDGECDPDGPPSRFCACCARSMIRHDVDEDDEAAGPDDHARYPRARQPR